MSKYCANCGRLLPEGVEVCPDCHIDGVENEAAPFTKITAATEVWKEEKPVREKKKPSQIRPILYVIAAIVAVAVAAVLIIVLQPANRVRRALNAGRYDQALEIYWGDESLSGGEGGEGVRSAVLRAAENILEQFKNREMDADTAAETLSKLGAFGSGTETALEDTYALFRALLASREHFEAAEKLYEKRSYLAAREEYLLVIEDDPDHARAQSNAGDCVDAYAEAVLSDANVLIQTGDYAAAIDALKTGERELLALTLYSEKIDYKLKACYGLYEDYILTEAERLADLRDYASAAALLLESMERHDFETETLMAAVDNYQLLARDKALAEADEYADSLYDQGEYAAAFEALEAMADVPDTDPEALAMLLAALEHRFSNDMCYEAKVLFGGERESLPDAIALLTDAVHTRATDELLEYRDDLSRYLPVSLAELPYIEKEGTIFRSTNAFEGRNGAEYDEGWVWGEDGASLRFRLEGAYDRLTASFTVRREENVEAGGYFELICDGEEAYKSRTLYHWETEPLEIDADISGCDELVIRFYNDYNTSTSENGYCYHGLCDPTLTKNIPPIEEIMEG